MLVMLRVPIENVISGIIHNLEAAMEDKGKKSPAKAATNELKYDTAQTEAAVCLFLYGYAVFNYEWYNKRDEKSEDKNKSLRQIWMNLVALFKYEL